MPQNTVMGSSSYASPAAATMRNDESATDTMISDMVPTCQETALENSGELAAKFSDVITQYSK